MNSPIRGAEEVAGDFLRATGAEAAHAAAWAAFRPLADRAIRHLADAEQWRGEGSKARPLRAPWSVAFARKGEGKQGYALQSRKARAFRALAAFVAANARKGVDRSPEGIEAWLVQAESVVQGVMAPCTKAAAPAADKEATALERAVALIARRAGDLTGDQRARLDAALRGVPAPAAPSAALPALPAPSAPLALPAPAAP